MGITIGDLIQQPMHNRKDEYERIKKELEAKQAMATVQWGPTPIYSQPAMSGTRTGRTSSAPTPRGGMSVSHITAYGFTDEELLDLRKSLTMLGLTTEELIDILQEMQSDNE